MAAKDRIVLPLDVSTEADAISLVKELRDCVGAFKIGLELFTSMGPRIVDKVREAGAERIFFDGKFHDIPNTVAGAARAAVRLGVWMFNVHTTGGSAMMRATVDAATDEADKLGVGLPIILGVTLLTSISADTLRDELSVTQSPESQVRRLAELAKASGLAGVVASPREIEAVKAGCGREFVVLTPGVRPSWASKDDQQRVMTPSEAVRRGSDYLVIGRPITGAKDRAEAAAKVIAELSEVE